MSLDSSLTIRIVPVLSDNYVYVLEDSEAGDVGVVDPGEAAPVIAALEAEGLKPSWVLLTHHHGDHIGGTSEIVSRYGARVAGAAKDAARLPKLDAALRPNEDWDFGGHFVEIIDTPGHTVGHIAYHFPKARAVFVGDTLFALGCGRLFEGTAQQMWGALSALAALPPETRVYFGHEYTMANAAFCSTIEPSNAALADYATDVKTKRAANEPTTPTTIGRELAANPFLRAADPDVKSAVGLPEADAASVFAEIRRRKDVA